MVALRATVARSPCTAKSAGRVRAEERALCVREARSIKLAVITQVITGSGNSWAVKATFCFSANKT